MVAQDHREELQPLGASPQGLTRRPRHSSSTPPMGFLFCSRSRPIGSQAQIDGSDDNKGRVQGLAAKGSELDVCAVSDTSPVVSGARGDFGANPNCLNLEQGSTS